MHNTRQLYWGHGLFLTPQHLQQQDLFHVEAREYFWKLINPFGWGINELIIRESGLSAGTFEVLRCELVTRDGIAIRAGSEVEQSNASLPVRGFEDFANSTKGNLGVFIGLPRPQAGQTNISTTASDPKSAVIPARFSLKDEERLDLFDPEVPVASITFVNHNLALLFDTENNFHNVDRAVELIKIAELELAPDGKGFRLSKDYIPPCVTIASSASLFNQLKGLRDLFTAKAQEFAAIRRQRGVRAPANLAQEAIRLQMLQTLSRYVPLLHHILEHPYLHPEPLYGLLRQMVGELSVFTEEVGILGAAITEQTSEKNLSPYDHENIWSCFHSAITQLQDMVRSMTLGAEAGIRLIYDGEFFKASLPPSVFEGERTRYYLEIDSLIRGEELWARLQKTGKITTIDCMPILRPKALMGLKISLLPTPPDELPQKVGNKSYFIVDTEHPEWKLIRQRGNIAMFCDLAAEETVIKLYVIPGN